MTTQKHLVLNKYRDIIPPDAIYIGRPTIWGNPWKIQKGSPRRYVIGKYREWLEGTLHIPRLEEQRQEILRRLPELKGKYVWCYCAPAACHGDVLVELANREELDALPAQI
jgi:hypothetical protein